MMKKRLLLITLLSVSEIFRCVGQNLSSAFTFLDLPVSAHVSALGGKSVSLTDEGPSASFSNPALLTNSNNSFIGLSYMNWLSSSKITGALYTSPIDLRSAYAISARYVDYGRMKETTPDNTITGTFTAKDIVIGGTYSYRLSEYWRGGVTGHLIYSKYSYLSSVAIGINLGLNYYNPETAFSFGLAAINLGGQIKSFENTFEHLPFDLAAGVTWKLKHAPVKITGTINQLTRWNKDAFSTEHDSSLSFGDNLLRHFSLGADFLLTEQLYIAAGCNLFNRAMLSDNGHKGLEGFSIGTGLTLKKVIFGIAYGKYQISTSSILFNFAYSL